MNKHKTRGISLLLAGFLMVAAAGGLHFLQEQQDAMAGENARLLLEQLEQSPTLPIYTPVADPTPSADAVTAADLVMPEADYMGYVILGTIRVPGADIELPVLRDWDYDLLDVAPCRYSGSIPNGNMILMGHNYRSHFSRLRTTMIGDEVEFVDVTGRSYHYTVDKVDILHKNDGELLPSEHPLILFTCTRSGQDRIVVRCLPLQN